MKEYLHLIALVLFSVGFFLVGYQGISEQGYGKLLALGITDVQAAYYIALGSVVVAPLLLYFALKTVGLSDWKCMFGGLLLATAPVAINNSIVLADPEASLMMVGAAAAILVAGLVSQLIKNRRAGLVFLLVVAGAAIYLGMAGGAGVNYYVGEYSLLLPFSFALLIEGIKERREDKVGPPIFGFAALLFSHPIGAAILACTSALGLAELWKEKERPILLEFLAVYSLCLVFAQGDPLRSAVTGLFGFIVFYAIMVMYNVKMRDAAQPAAILLMLVAILSMAGNLSAHKFEGNVLPVPSEETVGMYKWAGTGNGEMGIFAYPNAFEYYAGREAKVLDPLGTEWADNVIFTYDTLDAGVEGSPNLFYYMATSTAQDNSQYAIYRNGDYGLMMRIMDGRVDRSDADLIDINRQMKIKTVPFTKIKILDENLSYSDAKNRVVSVLDIEGSVLAEGMKKSREYSLPGAFVVRG
ncbi:MAG: hypothetical protein NTY83_04210 [Candidatus Micrarchaeota archaeon]|nr:hypothetical protein [Candidatus Micrarchaeota archaeon]